MESIINDEADKIYKSIKDKTYLKKAIDKLKEIKKKIYLLLVMRSL